MGIVNREQGYVLTRLFSSLAAAMAAFAISSTAFAQDKPVPAEPIDPFIEKCLSVIDVAIKRQDPLPVFDDYGKIRRRLVDQAAAEAIEQVVGMAVASDREVKMALHNEVADSNYSEKLSGGSEGLVRTKVVKEEVLTLSDGRVLSMEFAVSVCIPKAPKRPTARITGTPEAFFDPLTGAPKIWYWQNSSAEFEFFDNEGFHPGTGEPLKSMTRDVINTWRLQEETRKAAEQERLKQEAERRERDRQQAQLANRCDDLAANPYDKQRPTGVAGVNYGILRLNADEAVSACRAAIAKTPSQGRYSYQLGRALQAGKSGSKEAIQFFRRAIELGHVAAYDNLGNLLTGQGRRKMFEDGVNAGDPSSMYSLAGLLEPQGVKASAYISDVQRSLSLYKKAGELGHTEAKQKFEELSNFLRTMEKNEAARLQQDQQNQRMMMETFGNILNRVGR